MHLCDREHAVETVKNVDNNCFMCRVCSTYVSSSPGLITNVLQDKSLLEECFENLSLSREKSLVQLEDDTYNNRQEVTVTARDVVFRKCGQTEPLPFEKCYPNR